MILKDKHQPLVKEVKEVLNAHLYGCMFKEVKAFRTLDDYISIIIAVSDYEINRVKGQYPQCVALLLDPVTMDLHPQSFGCSGGQHIYREIDPTNEHEKYYAMWGVKVPFRKPKKEKKFVLRAIAKFCDNYVRLLQENRTKLRRANEINYDFLLIPINNRKADKLIKTAPAGKRVKFTKKAIADKVHTIKTATTYTYSCNINGLQFEGSESINFSNALLNDKGDYTHIGDYKNKQKFINDIYDYLNK